MPRSASKVAFSFFLVLQTQYTHRTGSVVRLPEYARRAAAGVTQMTRPAVPAVALREQLGSAPGLILPSDYLFRDILFQSPDRAFYRLIVGTPLLS
jgi:hypothetical protein